VKNKITKALLSVIAVLLASEAFFAVIHFVIADKYQRMNNNLVSEYLLNKETSDLVNSFYDLIQYSNDQKRVTAFKDNLNNLRVLLSKLDKDLANNESWASYIGTKNTVNAVIEEATKGVDNISAGNFSEVTSNYLKAAEYGNFVKQNTGALLLKELESAEKTRVRIAETRFWSETAALVINLLVAIACILYSLSFSKKITNTANGNVTKTASTEKSQQKPASKP
jgi:hypothetical protein